MDSRSPVFLHRRNWMSSVTPWFAVSRGDTRVYNWIGHPDLFQTLFLATTWQSLAMRSMNNRTESREIEDGSLS